MRIEVIVPARNAGHLLADCLATIDAQTVRPTKVHLSVAPSLDDTAVLAATLAADDPAVVVHENAAGDRASGLNLALAALADDTEAVAMVDAQSRLAPDYLERAAEVLTSTGAAVVGGPMRPVGLTEVGRGVAAALTSPAGVGDSSFHFEGEARDADSVYLGIYRRAVFDDVGPYDPTLLRTEDDDLNARIRARGGRIRLDPAIRSTYLGRQTLPALFRQYQGYGHSKVALAAVRPDAIRPRHLVPASLVAAFVAAGIVSLVWWRPALPLLAAVYALPLLVVAMLTRGLSTTSRLAMAGALAAMHWGYGLGSWQAILARVWRR
jgi:cellulose synthase/poly-beta-1,6-N-acetylglucosamine synthase-like glycosyltransferase